MRNKNQEKPQFRMLALVCLYCLNADASPKASFPICIHIQSIPYRVSILTGKKHRTSC